MALDLGGKILLGTVTTIAIPLGGYGIYDLATRPDTIGALLSSKENIELLKAGDQKWTQLIEKYKKHSESAPKIDAIDGFDLNTTSSGGETEEQRFLKTCQDLWNTKLNIEEGEKTKKETAIRNSNKKQQ